MSKDTGELFVELKTERDIKKYLDRNQDEFIKGVQEYLEKKLHEKNLKISEIVKKSGLNRDYVYKTFRGENKKPSRTKILAIGLAMQLNLEEMQYLLRYAQLNLLYPRKIWDSIIISAINQKLSVIETNELLFDLGETELLN